MSRCRRRRLWLLAHFLAMKRRPAALDEADSKTHASSKNNKHSVAFDYGDEWAYKWSAGACAAAPTTSVLDDPGTPPSSLLSKFAQYVCYINYIIPHMLGPKVCSERMIARIRRVTAAYACSIPRSLDI